jgi:hypothetical protein
MNPSRLATAAAAAIALAACGDENEVTLAPRPPVAFVRYVHIVPDTSAMDWRPIDAVENSPWAYAMTFRANTPYQAMGAGARRLRIFPTSEDISITSQIVMDSTITFTANTYYTVIHLGLARPGQAPADRLWVIEDQIPATIGAGQFALRVIHAGVGLGSVDVASASSTTGTFSNVFTGRAYGSASAYQLVPTGPLALRATDAGTSTVVAAASLLPAGAAAGGGLSAAGGSTIGGSAVTAIVVPRSVPGSRAPSTFTTPAVIYLIDRAPK